jgi:hypothetical protein
MVVIGEVPSMNTSHLEPPREEDLEETTSRKRRRGQREDIKV